VISRVTIYSFLAVLLIGSVIGLWIGGHYDDCDRYMRGDHTLPPTQMVDVGARIEYVPCDQWWGRQPLWVQALCLAEGTAFVVFLMNGVGNLLDWMRLRRMRHE
jgi:hypothetical protein